MQSIDFEYFCSLVVKWEQYEQSLPELLKKTRNQILI
jgi:hypothetical protein